MTGHTLAVGSGTSALAGQLVIGTNGLVTVAGPMSVTHSGGPADPSISFANGDGARIDVLSGGTLDLASDANRVLANGTNFLIHVFSGGTLKETATGLNEGGSTVDIPVDNDGQILATAGRLLLRGGTGAQTSSGTYSATSPATIAYQGDTNLSTTAPAHRHRHDGVQRRHADDPDRIGGAAVGLRPGRHKLHGRHAVARQ